MKLKGGYQSGSEFQPSLFLHGSQITCKTSLGHSPSIAETNIMARRRRHQVEPPRQVKIPEGIDDPVTVSTLLVCYESVVRVRQGSPLFLANSREDVKMVTTKSVEEYE